MCIYKRKGLNSHFHNHIYLTGLVVVFYLIVIYELLIHREIVVQVTPSVLSVLLKELGLWLMENKWPSVYKTLWIALVRPNLVTTYTCS